MNDDGPIITVYCEGPPDNSGNPTHDRYVVLEYKRINFENRSYWGASDEWNDNGRIRRTRTYHRRLADDVPADHPSYPREPEQIAMTRQRLQTRLYCPRCGFDEQRSSGTNRLVAFLDALCANGIAEVSIRAMIDHCWP